jgi:hypothetical protein
MVLLFHNSSQRESEKKKQKKKYKYFITEYLALQNFKIPIFIFQDYHLCSVNDLDITVFAVTYV